MSATIIAFSIVGVPFDAEKLKKIEKVRGCSHTVLSTAKFCPECGKPVWVTQVTQPYDGDDKYLGLDVVSEGERSPERTRFIGKQVGQVSVYDPGPDFFEVNADLISLKSWIKSILEPAGLWDEEKFGLYTCLYYS